MRKKTLISLIALIVTGLVSIAGGYFVGSGMLGQSLSHYAYYGFIFGVPALGAATVGLTTLSIQGVIKRGHAKNAAKENIRKLAMIKDKSKCYKYSKALTKNFSYLTKNNRTPIFGTGNRRSKDYLRTIDSYTYRRDVLGDKHAGRVLDKELSNMDRRNKLNPLGTAGTCYGVLVVQNEGGVTYSESRIPSRGIGFQDHRNEIQCFYPQTRSEYFKIAQDRDSYKEEKNSSGIKAYKDFGYETSFEFENGVLPNVFVKSNAEKNMEEYELMILKDARQKIVEEKKEVSAFPILMYKKHYGNDRKCIENASRRIENKEELDERINLLERVVKNSKSVKISHDHYVYADYRKTTIKDPDFDKEEIQSQQQGSSQEL